MEIKTRSSRRDAASGGPGSCSTCLLLFPAGIPMMVVGHAKLFIADGAPAMDQRFTRLEKAKL